MKTIEEIIPLVIEWAKEKNIHTVDCTDKQYLKLIEEVGELAQGLLKDDVALIKDSVGDIAVVLIILSYQNGVAIDEPSEFASFYKNDLSDLLWQVRARYIPSHSLDLLMGVANYYGYSLEECLNLAWNEIKDRKGKTIDGVFIKEK